MISIPLILILITMITADTTRSHRTITWLAMGKPETFVLQLGASPPPDHREGPPHITVPEHSLFTALDDVVYRG